MRPPLRPALASAIVVLALTGLALAVRSDARAWYFATLLVHPLAGLATLWLIAGPIRRAWSGMPAWDRLAAALFAITGATGLVLAVAAIPAVRGLVRVPGTVLDAHIWAGALVGAALLVTIRRARAIGAGLLAAIVGSAMVLAPAARFVDRRFPPVSRIVNPALPPASMNDEGQGASGPFFPSSAETADGRLISSHFFMTSEQCGRCHADIYEEWRSSMHHFSSFNNQWYRKSIEYMQEVTGTTPSKWCAGCHDHAMLFSGTFDRPAREQIDTPEAQAGLGCMSCHAITQVKSTMGQADFVIAAPPLHELATSRHPLLRFAHDYLLYLDPEPHRRIFMKSFHREQTPEFCSACHKVHLDVPVNHYRWIRGFNDYDNWQASGVSGEGARSFYYPDTPKACPDCHMPLVPSTDPAAKDGRVRSHRFAAANTAVPFVNGDDAQLQATTAFLRAGQVSVDIFGLARGSADAGRGSVAAPSGGEPRLSSTFAVGEESSGFGAAAAAAPTALEVTGPIGIVGATVRRGESVRLEVVVRTRNVGHFFPAGTVDGFDVWLEVEVTDSNGRAVFGSGRVLGGGSGPVEPSAHFYRSLMLDGRGAPINKRNAWMSRSVAYVRLIPPGAADTVHYRLDVPRDAPDRLTVTARLRYRKFAWWFNQWAYAGVRDPSDTTFSVSPGHDSGRWVFSGEAPDLPIVTLAEDEAALGVLPENARLPQPKAMAGEPVSRGRWNDYGIGLLLQGDLRGAEAAFREVTRIDPTYADGWINLGRARLQEGSIESAEAALRRALDLDPALARTHFFLGMALKGRGAYDEALEHLEFASARYPRDRVVLNQIGRVQFLQGRLADAARAFQRVLAIDAEDLQAHYNLMLSYQGLGDRERSARHEALYRRFKADEASQSLTGGYRQLHPDDNNERQAVHEHRQSGRAP